MATEQLQNDTTMSEPTTRTEPNANQDQELQEPKYGGFTRFEIELEFVQCLYVSPLKLSHISSHISITSFNLSSRSIRGNVLMRLITQRKPTLPSPPRNSHHSYLSLPRLSVPLDKRRQSPGFILNPRSIAHFLPVLLLPRGASRVHPIQDPASYNSAACTSAIYRIPPVSPVFQSTAVS